MDRTETAMARALLELLEEKPLDHITVKDIVNQCGVTRNTFYYHFQDIPTLFRRVMDEYVDKLVSENYVPDSPMACIRPLLQYGMEHRRAVENIYNCIPREVFQSYLDRLGYRLVELYFRGFLGTRRYPEEDVELLIYFFKCTFTGMMLDWLNAGMPEDGMARAERVCDLLESAVRRVLAAEDGETMDKVRPDSQGGNV